MKEGVIEQIDTPLIVAFLDDLEHQRGVSVRSRNLRLTAIHSFFRYAAFDRIGRSDKLQPADDSRVDAEGRLVDGTGGNPRGRYSVHFHRSGVHHDGQPARVIGAAVTDSPGWGFVNHSSYVEFVDNVAYDVAGSAFVTEAGDEIGAFHRNIAIHAEGSAEDVNARVALQDFGHQGDGFWFQGGGVAVTDNVAVGQSGSGFFYYTQGLLESGERTLFRADNLVDRSLAAGAEFVDVGSVPLVNFSNNTVYTSSVGARVRYNLRGASHDAESYVRDLTAWNNEEGLHLHYSSNLVIDRALILREGPLYDATGIRGNAVTEDVRFESIRVIGYKEGIEIPRRGQHVINGGFFNNQNNIIVTTPLEEHRSLLITGDVTFGELSPKFLGSATQKDVLMWADFRPFNGRVDHVFFPHQVTLDYGPYSNQRLYYPAQVADSIPFPSAEPGVPIVYVGKTNAKLFTQFGLIVGGGYAPNNALSIDEIVGFIARS